MATLRRLGVVLALSLGLTASIWLLTVPHRPPRMSTARGPVGYAAHVLGQQHVASYIGLIKAGGATSLRTDLFWSVVEAARGRFDWSGPDEILTEAAAHHLHVLMTIDTTPAWASGATASHGDWLWLPPRNPAAYGVFAAAVAARYGAGGTFWRENPHLPRYLPAGIELWNEENTSRFWGNEPPDPAVYAAMVKAGYRGIKRADPSMTVLIGGLAAAGAYDDVNCSGHPGTGHDDASWNGINYLQALYAAGIRGYFDAVGWHPYNYWRGATATEMLAYSRCSAWSQMASTPVSVRSLMDSHGDASKRIWITETGAPTCVPGAAYVCVSPVQQADLAAREAGVWPTLSWAGGFYWYDIRDDEVAVGNVESHFGVILPDDTPKPAYLALKQVWQALRRPAASSLLLVPV
jgi:polysaccharide biosynthesis protein PslG